MNLVITGASGFIGSYLCTYLLKKGHTVVATARNKNKMPHFDQEQFFSFEVDVLNPSSLANINDFYIDAVVHTATSNDILSKNVSSGIELSTVGTKNVLDFCVERKIPKILFFSTFQVYGTELNGTINERTPIRCQSNYGINHLFGEQYIEMYSREKSIMGIAIRPSNVYGRFTTPFVERWTLVPGCFCKEAFLSNTITLLSSGKQTRNFVGLHEVSAGVSAILDHKDKGFSVYNIASNENLNMLSVAEMVQNIFEERYGRKVPIKVMNDEPRTSNSFTVDLEKLQHIGYQPERSYNLETEINQIFDHLEKNTDEPN